MINKDAIEALQHSHSISSANSEITDGMIERRPLALPPEMTLHDLERYQPLRYRLRGNFKTTDIASLADYVEHYRSKNHGAVVFVAHAPLSATAVLNLGNEDEPGHADHLAQLDLQMSPALKALMAIDGRAISQRDCIEFIEDWLDHMQFFSDGNQLTKGLALNAIRSINIEAMRKAENTVSNFSETGSVLEQISANSKETLPSLIYFTCFPYEGLDSREFVVRLGIITSDDKPRLCLRIRQFDQHREEMRKELAEKIQAAVLDLQDVKVLNGTFASK